MKKFIVALVVLIAVFGMTSCSLVNGLFYPYIGTWENADDGGKITIILEKDSYEMIMQYEDADGSFVNYSAVRGELVVESDTMIMYTDEYREADDDGVFPDEWTEAEGLMALPQTGTWVVEGDTLTFTDTDSEDIVFTEVK